MKEHKHAVVLRAVADGIPLREFEARMASWGAEYFVELDSWLAEVLLRPESWEIRRKQQVITVNGFKVPKPVDVTPEQDSEYFIADVTSGDFFEGFYWCGNPTEAMFLSRGLIHKTKEAAIAHAKAMLGIDPGLSTGEQHDES